MKREQHAGIIETCDVHFKVYVPEEIREKNI